MLSGKRAESGELSTNRSIRRTACCQVRGLTQTPALVKGKKCNRNGQQSLWRKKNETRRRPRRAGRAQETWAGFQNAAPIIELRQLKGADLGSASPLMERSIFFFSNSCSCDRARILPYATLLLETLESLGVPTDTLRCRIIAACAAASPCSRPSDKTAFGEERLVSFQKSVAAQVSGRLQLPEEFGGHKESQEAAPAGFSAVDRAKASTHSIFIAGNGQTCRRFLPRSSWRWIEGTPNAADDASTGSLTSVGSGFSHIVGVELGENSTIHVRLV